MWILPEFLVSYCIEENKAFFVNRKAAAFTAASS